MDPQRAVATPPYRVCWRCGRDVSEDAGYVWWAGDIGGGGRYECVGHLMPDTEPEPDPAAVRRALRDHP